MNWRAFFSGILGGALMVATLSLPQMKAQTPWAAYPLGTIVMTSLSACPSGTQELAAFNGAMPEGTLAANGDVGTTGGSNTITPTGQNGTVSFTPNGSNGTVSFTPAGTVSAETFGTTKFTTNSSGTAAFTSVTGGHVFNGSSGTIPAETFVGQAGTVPAETFNGTQFDNRPAYVKVIYCQKT